MYGETPSVSYTVCVNHVVEKVVSFTGGTVVYNTILSVGAVVEAAEIPLKLSWKCHGSKTYNCVDLASNFSWKLLRKLSWKLSWKLS